jgi:hypothetical protein
MCEIFAEASHTAATRQQHGSNTATILVMLDAAVSPSRSPFQVHDANEADHDIICAKLDDANARRVMACCRRRMTILISQEKASKLWHVSPCHGAFEESDRQLLSRVSPNHPSPSRGAAVLSNAKVMNEGSHVTLPLAARLLSCDCKRFGRLGRRLTYLP